MATITKTATILKFITANSPATIADIMKATKIDSQNTNGFCRSLLRQDLVKKVEKDGFIAFAAVTAKAKAVTKKTAKPAAKKSAKAPKMELSPKTAADHAASEASSAAARASLPARHKAKTKKAE